MPIIPSSSFSPPRFLRNPHLQTIIPALFRNVSAPSLTKERILTDDGDFLDVDWFRIGSNKIAILTHGLEGSSDAPYVRGMAKTLGLNGWDVLAWNFRGCSGSENNLPRFYHSGESKDLETVINHVLKSSQYDNISLIGFSVGGNITLKLLGEKSSELPLKIQTAVAISAPCDLKSSAEKLSRGFHRIYLERFLFTLRKKIRSKAKKFPDKIDLKPLTFVRTFRDFDEAYTAPLHGFDGAEDYWNRSSSIKLLDRISIPCLILSAIDDPFLARPSLPTEIASSSKYIYLETPRWGGHVGFIGTINPLTIWSEQRTLEFIDSL